MPPSPPVLSVLGVLAVVVPMTTPSPPQSRKLPRFERVLLLEPTSETSANVSVGDVDRDGHPDVVIAK